MRQIIAAWLLSASWDIPRPEFHRHELARRTLLQCMRVEDPGDWRCLAGRA